MANPHAIARSSSVFQSGENLYSAVETKSRAPRQNQQPKNTESFFESLAQTGKALSREWKRLQAKSFEHSLFSPKLRNYVDVIPASQQVCQEDQSRNLKYLTQARKLADADAAMIARRRAEREAQGVNSLLVFAGAAGGGFLVGGPVGAACGGVLVLMGCATDDEPCVRHSDCEPGYKCHESGDCYKPAKPQCVPKTETCNGKDDDCDGEIDDGLPIETYYPDDDGDTYGAGQSFTSCKPAGATRSGDCNDQNKSVYPGAKEIPGDGIDQDCNGKDLPKSVDPCAKPDKDGDGYKSIACGGKDCNDNNSSIYPGAKEIPGDGIDQDCSGKDLPKTVATCAKPDNDGDGYAAVACGGKDCNDNSKSIHPGASEVCNGYDDNCQSGIDEGVKNACGTCGSVPYEVCDGKDNNCNGKIDEGVKNACGKCGPAPAEVCDGKDNNCNGTVDEGCPKCGNGQCEGGENSTSCPSDCKPPVTASCGNLKCETGETATSCAIDCDPKAQQLIACAKEKCPEEAQACQSAQSCISAMASIITCVAGCNDALLCKIGCVDKSSNEKAKDLAYCIGGQCQ